MYTFFEWIFCEEIKCATNFLLDDKLEIENAVILTDFGEDKAVLEPRVSPAFAITYFGNHCNIRFENASKYVDTLTFFSKNLNQRSLTPRLPLTHPMSVGVTCVTLP